MNYSTFYVYDWGMQCMQHQLIHPLLKFFLILTFTFLHKNRNPQNRGWTWRERLHYCGHQRSGHTYKIHRNNQSMWNNILLNRILLFLEFVIQRTQRLKLNSITLVLVQRNLVTPTKTASKKLFLKWQPCHFPVMVFCFVYVNIFLNKHNHTIHINF